MIQVNVHSDLMKIICLNSGYSREMKFANKLHDMTLEMEDKNQRYFLFVEDEDDAISHPIGLVVFDPQKLITDQPRPNTIAFAFCNTDYGAHTDNKCTPTIPLEWGELESINNNICYFEIGEEGHRPSGVKRTSDDLMMYRSRYIHIRFKEYYSDGNVMVTKGHSNLKKQDVVDYRMMIPMFILKETYNYFNALRAIHMNKFRMPGVVLKRPVSYFICDHKEEIQ